MNANKALWEKGDFTQLAATMRQSGEEIVAELQIGPGMDVLDLGCGDGTTALPAALTGAKVCGINIARNLVEAGNRRAQQAGLSNLAFHEGDDSDLQGIADESFDVVLTMFGAMFAPKPDVVAKEMVRVTRAGGRIMMGNWIPGDPTLVAQILRISSAYSPPPLEGFVSPMTWGDEDIVRDRFVAAGIKPEDIKFERATYVFRYPGSPAEFLATFRDFYGPTMNAFEAAAKQGKEAQLEAELAALFERQNRSGSSGTEIPATFLKVIACKAN